MPRYRYNAAERNSASISSSKYLKLVYSIAYINTCILAVCVHLSKHSVVKSHSDVLDTDSLDPNALHAILKMRGIVADANEKNHVTNSAADNKRNINLIKSSGKL